jgi:CheY-like chemotaxis protein
MSARSRTAPRHAGASVLVVEDNPINREVAPRPAAAAGLQVDTVEDGRSAQWPWPAGPTTWS